SLSELMIIEWGASQLKTYDQVKLRVVSCCFARVYASWKTVSVVSWSTHTNRYLLIKENLNIIGLLRNEHTNRG
ncbi:hypothetical protein KA005_05220, partial [bacterium]|nr:hypothetical protein [bacterium]